MKVLTILGTRPEIIRLSRVIPRLDEAIGRENHVLVNTGQSYDANLSANFFKELGVRQPEFNFQARGSFGEQLATIFHDIEALLVNLRPDRVLVLGDTNSSLAAIIAARLHVPVYHMEAGNRSYDPKSPEEVNRRLIDHVSSIHLPYTERSRQNLLAEGIPVQRIFVTGNPIYEVIQRYRDGINRSDVLDRLGLEEGKFFLVTLHREENVDDYARLGSFIRAFDQLQKQYEMPVVVSAHPRLRDRVSRLDQTSPPVLLANSEIHFLNPFGFFDFIALERSAFCVLTDSGTVQEETAILGVPSVVLRDHTERPETVECGASVLSGADPERILDLVKLATEGRAENKYPCSRRWSVPDEYLRENVADTVVRILASCYGGPVQ